MDETIILDVQGRIVFCNDFALELVGWQRDDILGKDWFDCFLPPDTGSEARSVFSRSILSGAIPNHHKNEIRTRTGERRLVAVHSENGDRKGSDFKLSMKN